MRFKSFVNFKDEQYKDTSYILDGVGVSVSVYRQQSPSGEPGIDTEIPSHTFYKKILVYLQPMRSRGTNKVRSDVARGANAEYQGITQDKDVLMGDQWRFKGDIYEVMFKDETATGKTEVRLNRKI